MYDKATSISRRGVIKGQLTRLGSYAKNFSTADGDINQLKIRKQKAQEFWDEFQQIQQEIEQNEDAESEEDYRIEFEELYFDVVASCETLIEKRKMSSVKKRNENEDALNQEPIH